MFGRQQAHLVLVPGRLSWTDPSVPARACCCPARPVVKVFVPLASGMRMVDLWLCGHHYRASQAALNAAGAVAEELDVPADRSRHDRVAATG